MTIVTKYQSPPPLLIRGEDLPYEDGVPLESSWHLDAMYLLISILRHFWRDRTDVYIGGNMFVYFDPDQVKSRNFCGPDFFVIKGVADNTPRNSWVIWEEDYLTPNFVIELASKSTAMYDITDKKDIYEFDLETENYIIYNPETDILQGWQLALGRYVKLQPNEQGWLWCSELDLWLGTTSYQFVPQTEPVKVLRFFDKAGNLIPTPTESETKARQAAEAEIERLKALLQKQNK